MAAVVRTVFAEEVLFLGDDLLPWLVFAFGAAMVAGNLVAMFRPPPDDAPGGSKSSKGRGERDEAGASGAPQFDSRRAWIMIGVGAVAAIWALATLLQ